MKKLITLTFALMLSVSMGFAQNNSSTTNQSGNGNSLMVDQTGNDNASIIDQSSSFGTGQTAVVDQDGSENSSDILQDQANAEAYVTQSGVLNSSSSKQSGYNILNVDQAGENNTLAGYDGRTRAFQKNGSGAFASDMNELDLDQVGDNNVAGVWQEHHAEATISQTGDDNNVQTFQTGSPQGALNEISITQNGDLNKVDANQDGNGNGVLVELGVYGGANGNDVDFDQIGDRNYLETKQIAADDNMVTGSQDGNDNYFRVTVRADDNVVDMSTTGDENRGSWGVSSDVPGASIGNTLTISQDGNVNYTTGDIKGDDNTVDITQTGDQNRVGTSWYTADGVVIDGSSNSVSIIQDGNDQSSLSTITGNGNSVTVNQSN